MYPAGHQFLCSAKLNLLPSPHHEPLLSPPFPQNEEEKLTVFRPFARECLGELLCKLTDLDHGAQTVLDQTSAGFLKLRYTHFGPINR